MLFEFTICFIDNQNFSKTCLSVTSESILKIYYLDKYGLFMLIWNKINIFHLHRQMEIILYF